MQVTMHINGGKTIYFLNGTKTTGYLRKKSTLTLTLNHMQKLT